MNLFMLSEEDRRRIEAEEQYREQVRSQYRQSSPFLGRPAVAGVALALGAGLLYFALSNWSDSPRSESAVSALVGSIVVPAPKFRTVPQSRAVAPGPITVKARSSLRYKLVVTPAMLDCKLTGKFRVIGGAGNDVEAVLANEDGITNWENRHQYSAFWSSQGRVTVGQIEDVSLRPGEYYLAFSNGFSLITDKQVFSDIQLVWNKLVAYVDSPYARPEQELKAAEREELRRLWRLKGVQID